MLKQSVRSFNFSKVTADRTIASRPLIGEAVDTSLDTSAVPPSVAPRLPMRWLQAARGAWRAARRRADDRRMLQAMGDAELRDLGIGRGEAGHLTQAGAKSCGRW